MTFLPPSLRSRIVRYLQLNWWPDAIAEEVGCYQDTVYRIEFNMQF